MNTKRAGFVVEHDFIMATYLADRYKLFNIKELLSMKVNLVKLVLLINHKS